MTPPGSPGRRYRALVAEVQDLLYRHDPAGIAFGDNPGEYAPEAGSVVARLPGAQSAPDVRTLVHEEFVRWFGGPSAGPPERYDALAEELWTLWRTWSAADF